MLLLHFVHQDGSFEQVNLRENCYRRLYPNHKVPVYWQHCRLLYIYSNHIHHHLDLEFGELEQNPDSRALIVANYILVLTAFTFFQVPLLPFLTCRYFGSEGAFIHSQLLRACRGTIHKFINPGRTIVPLSSSHRTTELHVPYHTVRFLIVTWIGIRFSNQAAGIAYHTDCSHLFCSRFAAHIVLQWRGRTTLQHCQYNKRFATIEVSQVFLEQR